METFATLFLVSLSLIQYFSVTYSITLTITNNCNDIIWPVVSPNPTRGAPSGFALSPGDSQTITTPPNWSGRLWARTRCSKAQSGNFLCLTGDCGTGTVDCSGVGKPSPPATAAEFSPTTYSISVVDGYNLPLVVVPRSTAAGGGGCTTVGCVIDYGNVYYPPELRATFGGEGNESVAGIKSACSALKGDEYCCTGGYSSVSNCKPNSYTELFKKWCPQARTYAYDGTTFSCRFSDFVINFCAPANSGFPYNGGGTTNNNGNYNPSDDSGQIYGKKKVDVKFGIIIGVSVGILGTLLFLYFWHRYWKNKCKPCTWNCCSLFSCTCCVGDHHHSDKC